MAIRPKRLYKTKTGKFYYLTKGKRKYVKKDSKSNKGNITINIQNIIKPRKKPSKKRKKVAFAINPEIKGLPAVIPKAEKIITSTEDIEKEDIRKKARIEEELKKKMNSNKDFEKIEKRIALLEDKKGPDDEEVIDEEIDEEPKLKEKVGRVKEIKETIPYGKTRDAIQQQFDLYVIKNKLKSNLDAWESFKETEIYNKKVKGMTGSKKMYEYDFIPTFEEDKKKKSGKGRQIARGKDGLFNTDIEAIARGLKFGPVPVIPSDKINILLDYVKKGTPKFGAIINTNPSNSNGSGQDGFRIGHWRAIFFDNDDDYCSAEYFDPLCEGSPPSALKSVMKRIAEKMNPEDYMLYKENALKRQANNTSTCGYHALKFIEDRMNNVPWSEATGYDEYMKKHKPDDSMSGEKDLVNRIKKYDKYI